MCCFSATVEVANTSIFARASSGNRQLLVYQMELRAAAPTAMILPLPVPPRSREDAVRFIDLSGYRAFFTDLSSVFTPSARSATRTGGGSPAALPAPRLTVHRVGSFEASFVPTLADFARLDERFRLPADAWDAIPEVRDWGFAVFKLRDLAASEATAIEPMALELPRRDPSSLFFPAVHIHDGTVHPTARFDHNLFMQEAAEEPMVSIGNRVRVATSSHAPVRYFAKGDSAGVLDPALPVQVVRFAGELPNHDARSVPPARLRPPDVVDLEAWRRGDQRLPAARAAGLIARLAAARFADRVTPSTVAASAWLAEQIPSARQDLGHMGSLVAFYGSPELFRGRPMDGRTEVYEVGALLYHMTAGRQLFTGESIMAAAAAHVLQAPPLLGEHAGLDAVLRRALAKEPADRFPSLRELAAALSSISQEGS